ncbi:MYND finger [Rhizoctonia solani]|uniref:MYND finger n=1 Tax=Rhizoctonia solani TaxID=456999 RepID=A0A8H7H6E5_9AGAM|nr:MYND finger [Rhizoctonia solani]
MSMTSPQQQNLIHHLCEICGKPTTLWYESGAMEGIRLTHSTRIIGAAAVDRPGTVVQTTLNRTGISTDTFVGPHTLAAPSKGMRILLLLRNTHVSIIGILFPVDEDRPRLIQLDCRARIDNSTGGPLAWQPVVTNIVNDDHPSQVVLEQGIAGDNLRFPIQLWSRGAFLTDGSALNQSIYRLTKGQATYPWKGPFIALKFSGTRRQGYVDMSLNDLPALVSHFLQVKVA